MTITQTDLSNIRAREVKAAVVLAEAFGWRVSMARDGVHFYAEDGTTFHLPSDVSGLRQSVYVSKIRAICRHRSVDMSSADARTLGEVAADLAKLRTSQRRQLLSAVADEIGPPPVPVKEEPVKAPEAPPVPEPLHVVETRPHQVTLWTKPDTNEVGYRDSTRATERTWSDGSIDYICMFDGCDFSNKRARSVSAHYGAVHTLPQKQRKHPRKRKPESKPKPAETNDAFNGAEAKLQQIIDIVTDGEFFAALAESKSTVDKLTAEVEELTAKVAAADTRAERATGTLSALQELVNGAVTDTSHE